MAKYQRAELVDESILLARVLVAEVFLQSSEEFPPCGSPGFRDRDGRAPRLPCSYSCLLSRRTAGLHQQGREPAPPYNATRLYSDDSFQASHPCAGCVCLSSPNEAYIIIMPHSDAPRRTSAELTQRLNYFTSAFSRAGRNSSPARQVGSLGVLATLMPISMPKRQYSSIPVKSQSSVYLSAG
jgi:hypothetical protein